MTEKLSSSKFISELTEVTSKWNRVKNTVLVYKGECNREGIYENQVFINQ